MENGLEGPEDSAADDMEVIANGTKVVMHYRKSDVMTSGVILSSFEYEGALWYVVRGTDSLTPVVHPADRVSLSETFEVGKTYQHIGDGGYGGRLTCVAIIDGWAIVWKRNEHGIFAYALGRRSLYEEVS